MLSEIQGAYEPRRRRNLTPIIAAFVTILIAMYLMMVYVHEAKSQPAPNRVTVWEHSSNPQRGMSLMRMDETPNGRVEITYDMPRTSLLDIGIRPGMLLFMGARNGDAFTGDAFIFGCGQSWPYRVTGYFTESRLRLQGPVPVLERDYNDRCYVARYTYDDPNANLIFWFRGVRQ